MEFNFQQPKRIRVGSKDMLEQASKVEWYQPSFTGLKLETEGGHSIPSYKNLCLLVDKLGKPNKVERLENGNFLIHWENSCYVATGFEIGYMGTGSFYLAMFGEKAGFGECDELYMQLGSMEQKPAVIWEKGLTGKRMGAARL